MEGLTRALKVEYQSHAPAKLAGGRSSREFEGGNLDTQNTSHSLDLFFVFVVQAICHQCSKKNNGNRQCTKNEQNARALAWQTLHISKLPLALPRTKCSTSKHKMQHPKCNIQTNVPCLLASSWSSWFQLSLRRFVPARQSGYQC